MSSYTPNSGRACHRLTPRQQAYVKRLHDPAGAVRDDLRRAVVDLVRQEMHADGAGTPYRLINVLPTDKHGEADALDVWRNALAAHGRIEAWLGMLTSVSWQLYAHLTFRQNVSYEHADKQYMKWINALSRIALGSRYTKGPHKGGLYWVRATEYQQRGALHFHVVIGNPSDRKMLIPELCAARWSKLAGDASVQYYDPQRGGLPYLVKSAAHDSCRIDVSDNLSRALVLSSR
jgi:hypothetical protein